MQVAGDFRLGETDSAGSGIYARLTGFWGSLGLNWGCIGPALLGIVGILLLRDDLDDQSRLLWLAVVLVFGWLPIVIGLLIRRLLRNARLARGATETAFCRFDADDDGLRASLDGVNHGIAWRKVTEIMRYRDLWIFAGSVSLCVPRRWFADAAAEAAFLNHALARLSPEAVARSWDATFVCSGKAAPWKGYGCGAPVDAEKTP